MHTDQNGSSFKKKQILFLANPISHALKGYDLESIIKSHLDLTVFDYKVAYTQAPQHGHALAKEAVLQGIDIVAAIGGDGTVNEVGSALVDSLTALAIIPAGSGNGLARHLGIPLQISQAVKTLNCAVPRIIDTGKIIQHTFLNAAGVGFDAHIAWKFAEFGKRGLSSYIQVAMREFFSYKPKYYRMMIDGVPVNRKALFISFANSSQYGNNFIIAPQASLQDGKLEAVIVQDVPLYAVPAFIYRFNRGSLQKSSYVETMAFKKLSMQKPADEMPWQGHIDGEPVLFDNPLNVEINCGSLKVMTPEALLPLSL